MNQYKKRITIIRYLLAQKRDQSNKFRIGKDSYDLKKIPEEEFVRELDFLSKEQLIKCSSPGKHPSGDLTNWREIELLPDILTYEKKTKSERRDERRNRFRIFREWATLIISIAALALSIYSIWLQNVGP